jgi:hypothetical protein
MLLITIIVTTRHLQRTGLLDFIINTGCSDESFGECSEDEDSFHYFHRGSTTKVCDIGVEFLLSDEEN